MKLTDNVQLQSIVDDSNSLKNTKTPNIIVESLNELVNKPDNELLTDIKEDELLELIEDILSELEEELNDEDEEVDEKDEEIEEGIDEDKDDKDNEGENEQLDEDNGKFYFSKAQIILHYRK